MYKLKIDDNHDSHAKANKSVSISIGLKGVSSVRMSSSTSSSRKNSVLTNIRIHPKTVEMHDRNTKKTNVTSQMNVVKNKNHVANVNVENTLKANVDVLCVLCDKNVLIPYPDKCFTKYKLSVNDKVRRALLTTPRTTKSESVDTTLVVAKTRFAVVTSLTAKETDSGALQSTLLFEPVIQLVMWLVDSGCSKHMTGNLKLLRNFIEKFIGIVLFRNDHFAGENLLTGFRDSNLYTISISNMAASSPVCLMSKATSTKSWLWHRRLSHMNFSTINHLIKQYLVDGLPKFEYDKDHLCLARLRRDCSNFQDSSKYLTETPSKEDLDNLFGPMYEEYYEMRTPEVSTNSAATTLYNKDTPSSSSIIVEDNDAP
ncbi:integrase, catalytic region, zinc finger, CCHC-type containing protein [Tanacetum coccineum]